MRTLFIAAVIAAVGVAAPASAQEPSSTTLPVLPMPRQSPTPHPHPSPRPTAVMTFSNPAASHKLSSASGASCNRNATAAQQRVNPITGQSQANTIVSVPIGKNAGTVASATNHQQQIDACAHGH